MIVVNFVHCSIQGLTILTMIGVTFGIPVMPYNGVARQQLSFLYGLEGHIESGKGSGHEYSGGGKERKI